jgi:hypothetical protein
MKKWMRFMNALAVAGLAVVAQAAHADVVIDTFSDAFQTITHNNPVIQPAIITTGAAIGGQREVKVVKSSGPGTVSVNVGGGYLAYNSDAATQGKATITWNGLGGIGLGGIDITQGGSNTGILMQGQSDNPNLMLTLTLFMDPTNYAYTTFNLPATENYLFLPFSGFTTVGSSPLSSVNKITLYFNGQGPGLSSADGYIVNDLRATSAPEPGTMALLGLGGLGMLRRLRRRRQDA